MPEWMAKQLLQLINLARWIGNVVCWILMPLIFAMVYEVIMRNFF